MRLSNGALARFLGLVVMVSFVACAPDGPDAYSAPVQDGVVTTGRVLPSTTLPPEPGDEYRHVFDTPGTYLYYCSIHGTKTAGMIGSVTVSATGV